jgi:hypothetical protein
MECTFRAKVKTGSSLEDLGKAQKEKWKGKIAPHKELTPQIRKIRKIERRCLLVWNLRTCPSLTRWVLEFGFQVNISLEYGPFEKLNRSNRI